MSEDVVEVDGLTITTYVGPADLGADRRMVQLTTPTELISMPRGTFDLAVVEWCEVMARRGGADITISIRRRDLLDVLDATVGTTEPHTADQVLQLIAQHPLVVYGIEHHYSRPVRDRSADPAVKQRRADWDRDAD